MHYSTISALADGPNPDTAISCESRDASPSSKPRDLEPPKKRRRVEKQTPAKVASTRGEDLEDYLTLARVDVALALSDEQQKLLAQQRALDLPGDEERVTLVLWSADIEDGVYQCQLAIVDGRPFADLRIFSTISLDTFGVLQMAAHLRRSKRRNSFAKAQCTILRCSTDTTITPNAQYKVTVRILWKNSKGINETPPRGHQDLLAVYAPEGRSEVIEPWHTLDFYDSVHVPDRNCNKTNAMQIDQLGCQLYPFQKRAVRWMLLREGMDFRERGIVRDENSSLRDSYAHGFYCTADADGRTCYVSHLLGIITTRRDITQGGESQIRGGILAEEMGLGKTVELIALICLHKRLSFPQDSDTPRASLRRSSATLVITPPSILQQWKSEIQTLAPSLKVMVYGGIRSEAKKADNEQLVKEMIGHDLILTTYNTLAKEIHYSKTPPERNMRHGKKYERRLSPLMQIDWWRVILDECQMVESGVSNAAEVAQLIPRYNAWAVSGTPLRKDAKDLLGLLIFLRYEPYCYSAHAWNRLILSYKATFRSLFGAIALRHTKEQVRNDIQLPTQKRVVITVPFTQIEEQHYSNLYQQMCDDCGLDAEGAPVTDSWDPESSAVVEKMRTWLTRLRQTCLHPEVGDRNRRALGRGEGPLRTVGEVLQVMIDQNETASRAEERAFIQSQIRRGQILEHAKKSQEALAIWLKALEQSSTIVHDCRQQLELELERTGVDSGVSPSADDLDADGGANSRTGLCRQRLRHALELEHACVFFVANAYYQIKTDENLTREDTDEYRDLEKVEEENYEKAKLLRKEMLGDTHSKAETLMASIKDKTSKQAFVEIPNIIPAETSGGIESRSILARLEDLCEAINLQAEQLDEWREKMIELLLLPLVDQEETDLKGDEYETSTKQQEDVYVYMEALRALVADRHDALTGQKNLLINHEMKFALEKARQGEGHSPQLLRDLLSVRTRLRPEGSMRGIATDLRELRSTLRGPEETGSARARAEISIINTVLESLQQSASKQAKTVTSLERELEVFRDTMNARLEYYRQLQQISDQVAPFEEELDEEDMRIWLTDMTANETRLQGRIATLNARGRYLLHLRKESVADDSQRLCIICQQPFEVGALTSCGHSYCKECLRLWWNAHRNCPTCKKHLSRNDFHQITYKPQELTMQEEVRSKDSDSGFESEPSSIYSGINSVTLSQIKNIDMDGSFGTKIDTLARHILWIRENDPGAKSIVFSQFRDFLDVLARAFTRFKIEFTSIDKKQGVEKFKKDPSIECFFLHAKAHSSGLNLVNATHVFLCEPLINTAIELQAIARVHRIGQHHATTVWMYLVEGTVEKAIYDISVTRRLSHIGRSAAVDNNDNSEVMESSIEAANSLEMQQAPLSKLLTKGPGGGELVSKEDLWNCLFGQKPVVGDQVSEEVEREVTRHLGASAAEARLES